MKANNRGKFYNPSFIRINAEKEKPDNNNYNQLSQTKTPWYIIFKEIIFKEKNASFKFFKLIITTTILEKQMAFD